MRVAVAAGYCRHHSDGGHRRGRERPDLRAHPRGTAQRRAAAGGAIRAGFDKALSAITDSNVTALIAGMALWVIGTGAIRGFAVGSNTDARYCDFDVYLAAGQPRG